MTPRGKRKQDYAVGGIAFRTNEAQMQIKMMALRIDLYKNLAAAFAKRAAHAEQILYGREDLGRGEVLLGRDA